MKIYRRLTAAGLSAVLISGTASMPAFAIGDNVRHKAFGSGVIVKMQPMGGDYLIEVNFERIGSKKLMLRVAAQHMSKE